MAKQLAEITLDQVFDELVIGLKDKNAYVRRAVVEALAKIKTHESYKALKELLEEGDPSYYVEAAATRAVGAIAAGTTEDKPKEEKVIKLLKSVLEKKAGWNEVVRSGAIAGLAELKTSELALNLLMEYTYLGIPQPLRLAAIRALGKISVGQNSTNVERILERLTEISKETFFLTQIAVVTALGQWKFPKQLGICKPWLTKHQMGAYVAMLRKRFPRCKTTLVPKRRFVSYVLNLTNLNNKTKNSEAA